MGRQSRFATRLRSRPVESGVAAHHQFRAVRVLRPKCLVGIWFVRHLRAAETVDQPAGHAAPLADQATGAALRLASNAVSESRSDNWHCRVAHRRDEDQTSRCDRARDCDRCGAEASPRRLHLSEAVGQTCDGESRSRRASVGRARSGGGGRDPVVVKLHQIVGGCDQAHSDRTAALPLRRNRPIPRLCLICPNTGSMLCCVGVELAAEIG